nr:MAG TPA: cysteine-rich protein [Caudoviricetes sp.]
MEIHIKCPFCESRVCDANSRVFVRTKITKLPDTRNRIRPVDYYIKCWKCKKTIGITKT